MNILRRFLLCLWSLGLIAAAAALGVCAFRPTLTQHSLDRLYRLLTGPQYFWWLLLAAVLLLLGGMLGVFVSLARKSAPVQVVVGKSEGGQVNISLDAVDNVVHKAVLSVGGVREVKSHLKAANNGVSIKLEVVLPHDTSVPETATAVQKAVKEQLHMFTGLAVAEVAVLVSTVEGQAAKTFTDQPTIV
jgi:uncharacterized alkaline shock family protein YloU